VIEALETNGTGMIHHSLLLILFLFFAMAVLFLLSQRLNISYPIFLVIGGLVISFIPGVPSININPDLVFLIFLPPLLFEAAWYSSWNQLWKMKRSILILGFGLVLVTSVVVAYFSISLIPGFTLTLGFLLGGIISPPDAVAAASVLKGMDVPKRALAILEGESLVNDAASLTVFRFAIAAVLTGQFMIQKASLDFLVLSVMGVMSGLVIASILYWILRFLVRSSSITTPMTLIAPYLMYMVAEEFQWSGVLAVVSGGLFLSSKSSSFLNYHTRLQTREVWATVGFLLNGFVFILIGLELPVIMAGLEEYSLTEAIRYALFTSAIVILIRIVLVYITAFLPRLMSRRIREREKNPGLKLPFIIGWAGMRGVVSLASALAIPLTLVDEVTPFPHRNLILFITFVVILITLVFQGLTLPLFIRWLKVEEVDDFVPENLQIEAIRQELGKSSIEYLDNNYSYEMEQYDAIARIKEQILLSMTPVENLLEPARNAQPQTSVKALNRKIMLEVVLLKRERLKQMEKEEVFDDQVLRALESNLDLEEARLRRI
jgi:Na+/H+ antiporter